MMPRQNSFSLAYLFQKYSYITKFVLYITNFFIGTCFHAASTSKAFCDTESYYEEVYRNEIMRKNNVQKIKIKTTAKDFGFQKSITKV